MNEFELRRLRQEGKEVVLSGGRSALDFLEELAFEDAEIRLDEFFARKAGKIGEMIEMEDSHNLDNPRLLGC